MYVCASHVHLLGSGKKVLDHLELDLQMAVSLCGCWELNRGPPEGQPVLSPAEHLSTPGVSILISAVCSVPGVTSDVLIADAQRLQFPHSLLSRNRSE